MSEALKELVWKMSLDTGKFEEGLAKAQTSFANTVHNITSMISGPLTAAFGALASGAALTQYINQADAIGKMADSIGIDIEALQAWGEAAERAGGSASAFQQTVKGLNQRLQEIAGGGGEQIKQTLSTIGVAATDSTGKARDVLDVLTDLAEKSENMDKQKFAGLAQKIGLDHGTIMLLQSGKLTLDDLIKRQKALGVYTKEDAEIAAKANDAIADFQQVLKAFAAILARVIVPGITFMTSTLTDFVSFIKDHKEFVLTAFIAVATVISVSMIPALWRMATAAWAAVAPFLPFIAAGVALGLVIDDLAVYIEGGNSALAGFWKQFGTGPEIAEKLSNAWNQVKSVFSSVWDVIKPYAPELMKLAMVFGALWVTSRPFLFGIGMIKKLGAIGGTVAHFSKWLEVMKAFSPVFQGCSTAVGLLKYAFVGLFNIIKAHPFGAIITVLTFLIVYWDDVKAAAIKCWNWISTTAESIATSSKAFFSEGWDKVTDGVTKAFTSAKENIVQIFDEAINTIKGWIDTILGPVTKAWDAIKGGKVKDEAKNVQEHLSSTASTDWGAVAEENTISVPIKPFGAKTATTGSVPSAAVGGATTNIKNEYTQQLTVSKIEVTAPDAQSAAESVRDELKNNGALAFKTDTGTRL